MVIFPERACVIKDIIVCKQYQGSYLWISSFNLGESHLFWIVSDGASLLSYLGSTHESKRNYFNQKHKKLDLYDTHVFNFITYKISLYINFILCK